MDPFASRLLRHLRSMERLRIEDTLETHGFCQHTLESGVRVSAVVSSEGPKSGERPEVFVRANRGERRLECERHAGYERAAARFVELVGEYCDARGPRIETDTALQAERS